MKSSAGHEKRFKGKATHTKVAGFSSASAHGSSGREWRLRHAGVTQRGANERGKKNETEGKTFKIKAGCKIIWNHLSYLDTVCHLNAAVIRTKLMQETSTTTKN